MSSISEYAEPGTLAASDPAAEGLALICLAAGEPRLLRAGTGREGLEDYRAAGGYADGLAGRALIKAVSAAGLRGRGGAAFPFGQKLAALASQPGPRFLVANGEEGEPASIKDRWLMRRRPHLVLDGLLRAADAIDAEAAWIYLSDPAAAESLRRALVEVGTISLPVEVFEVAPGYVAGEETAAVRALNGGPAKPTDKPPRPFESGVRGAPTLVSNVETLANLPFISVKGHRGAANSGPSGADPGRVLLTVTGAVDRQALVEAPLGILLSEMLARGAKVGAGFQGVLMGGFFGGLIGPRAADLALDYDVLRSECSGLGCGAIIVLGAYDCPVAAAADVMAYFGRENAGQCGACFRGTPAMASAIAAIAKGTASLGTVEKLKNWSVSLKGRGACGTLDGAAALAASLFREYPALVESHLEAPCPICSNDLPVGERTRFAV